MVLHESSYCMDGSSPIEPCQPSDTRCSGSWLHTANRIKSFNQKVPETCVVLWHYDRILPLQQVLLPTLRRRPVGKAVLSIFPTTPPCSTRVDVLKIGNVPIIFSLPQMKNLGTTVGLDPKGDKNYMSGLWLVLFSS